MDTQNTSLLAGAERNQQAQEDSVVWYKNWKTLLKIFILFILFTCVIVAIIFHKRTGEILKSFLTWMQDNAVAGSFAFIALYFICTVLFIPGSILTLGAGFVFRVVAGAVESLIYTLTPTSLFHHYMFVQSDQAGGLFLASFVVLCGAALGASTAFLLGRFVFRDSVAKYKQKYEKFDIIDKVVEQQGLKVTILLRLSPVIPFSAFNYFMGLTGVKFRDYNIAHLGMIPGTLAYCFIGGTLGAIGDSAGEGIGSNPVVLTLTIVGTVLAVIGMIYISFIAKKEFNKIAEAQKEKEMNATDYEAPIASAPNETSNDAQIGNVEVDDEGDDDELYEKSVSLGN